MFHPSRGGVRGGRDQFSWDNVLQDKQKDYYLGHSLIGKKNIWEDKKGASASSGATVNEEIQRMRQLEEELLNEKLGLAPKKDRTTIKGLQKHEIALLTRRGAVERTEKEEADMTNVLGLGALSATKKKNQEGEVVQKGVLDDIVLSARLQSAHSNDGAGLGDEKKKIGPQMEAGKGEKSKKERKREKKEKRKEKKERKKEKKEKKKMLEEEKRKRGRDTSEKDSSSSSSATSRSSSESPKRARHDSRSPTPQRRSRHDSRSPTPQRRSRHDSRSPTPRRRSRHDSKSPTPQRRSRHDSRSPTPQRRSRHDSRSPTPQRRSRHDSRSPTPQRRSRHDSKSPTPQRRSRHDSKSPTPRRRT